MKSEPSTGLASDTVGATVSTVNQTGVPASEPSGVWDAVTEYVPSTSGAFVDHASASHGTVRVESAGPTMLTVTGPASLAHAPARSVAGAGPIAPAAGAVTGG